MNALLCLPRITCLENSSPSLNVVVIDFSKMFQVKKLAYFIFLNSNQVLDLKCDYYFCNILLNLTYSTYFKIKSNENKLRIFKFISNEY